MTDEQWEDLLEILNGDLHSRPPTGFLVDGSWDKVNHVSRNNCYWNAANGKVDFVGKWQTAGNRVDELIGERDRH